LDFLRPQILVDIGLTKNLIELLDIYELRKKIVIYVKDEKFNQNIMIVTLKLVVSYEVLGLGESF
jgi:signal transduction histidine kinase